MFNISSHRNLKKYKNESSLNNNIYFNNIHQVDFLTSVTKRLSWTSLVILKLKMFARGRGVLVIKT